MKRPQAWPAAGSRHCHWPAGLGQAITSLDPVRAESAGLWRPLTGRGPEQQEEPLSHFLGLSKGSGQSFWQESPHGRDCRGQFLGAWSRTEKDGERMWDGDEKMKREDSPAQTRSHCDGFGKKHREAEPGQLQRKRKHWGEMCGTFRKERWPIWQRQRRVCVPAECQVYVYATTPEL